MINNLKIILAMVMSLDGKTTQWEKPHLHDWTSKEDQKHFSLLLDQHTVIIMGRKTYDSAASQMNHIPSRLRVVMTHSPKKYESFAKPGMLEFTNESPLEIYNRLKNCGKKNILLLGGEQINTLFFRAKLIDEIWITIEPKLFGKGNSLITNAQFDIQLKLKSSKKLNKNGTLLLKYRVC